MIPIEILFEYHIAGFRDCSVNRDACITLPKKNHLADREYQRPRRISRFKTNIDVQGISPVESMQSLQLEPKLNQSKDFAAIVPQDTFQLNWVEDNHEMLRFTTLLTAIVVSLLLIDLACILAASGWFLLDPQVFQWPQGIALPIAGLFWTQLTLLCAWMIWGRQNLALKSGALVGFLWVAGLMFERIIPSGSSSENAWHSFAIISALVSLCGFAIARQSGLSFGSSNHSSVHVTHPNQGMNSTTNSQTRGSVGFLGAKLTLGNLFSLVTAAAFFIAMVQTSYRLGLDESLVAIAVVGTIALAGCAIFLVGLFGHASTKMMLIVLMNLSVIVVLKLLYFGAEQQVALVTMTIYEHLVICFVVGVIRLSDLPVNWRGRELFSIARLQNVKAI